MGMLLTRVSFSGSTPSLDQLEQKLAETTQMHVDIEVVADDPSADVYPRYFQIHFTSPADSFKHSIWCDWSNNHEFHIHEPVDALNRCPNYLLYALVAALIDLGGVAKKETELPVYARVSFTEWKQLNRGIQPPKWKIAVASVGTLIYFCWLIISMLLLLPIYLLLAPFCWLRVRKQFRKFKQRKGFTE